MAERRLADAIAADAAAQSEETERSRQALLDSVAPTIDAEDEALWTALEQFRSAAIALDDTYRHRQGTIAYLIGNVTSTVPPGTDGYSQGPEGVRVHGRIIRNVPEISVEVAGVVAPLVAIGLPAQADQLRQAHSVGNPLRPPRSHEKAA
jgi:hypothetical protein